MVTVDGVEFAIDRVNMNTIYQFLYSKGIIMPCFCYHEKLSIAGNCRMCLVEANNAMVVSCAMPLLDKMQIVTKSQRLLHARENVLEFLLANHPLDCPVCDQGGECDLQDISKTFGLDRGRFYEIKRSVDNLNCFGPMIKTIMTRCIHCTRCVRFLNEYCDVYELGIIDRGGSMKINTYIDSFIYDELCGNIIDLCPVGALTSMPYAFSARPWELKSIESIDILDSLASSIRLDIINNNVIRVLPVLTESINEDWLTNKARFSFDVLNTQRITMPSINIDNNNIYTSWIKALTLILLKINSIDLKLLEINVNNYLDLETGWALKNFFNSIGADNINYNNINSITDYRYLYMMNMRIINLENVSLVIMVDINLRLENPLLNSRLRKNFNNRLKKNKLLVYSFGLSVNYTTFPIINLGNSIKTLASLCQWKLHKFQKFTFSGFNSLQNFNIFIPNKINPVLLIGSNILNRKDSNNILRSLYKFSIFIENKLIKPEYPIYNLTNNYLGKITYNELGFRCKTSKNGNKINYYINSEPEKNINNFSIYQGPFLINKNINVFLPTAVYTECINTYMNIEMRIRLSKIATSSERHVLTDVEVFRLLYKLKNKIIKHNFSILENFYVNIENNCKLINYDNSFAGNLNKFFKSFEMHSGFSLRSLNDFYLKSVNYKNSKNFNFMLIANKTNNNLLTRNINNNYYSSDNFIKMSKLMSLCSNKVIISHFSKKL